ncbi:FMN-binding protein [Cellulosilyticum sp. WCF-2]|uniref:FMN-binding protein n=1 Tax=Cellulosilyticum sp. WCF-2 TaxID=2497860 RepID=UPI000F8ECCB8|nr:FMN-binding protein [Cellulosilyticum sp. WCF-2]QEH67465.1 FMN-binding protein [Cellulosilyticum sp. WCF-2]
MKKGIKIIIGTICGIVIIGGGITVGVTKDIPAMCNTPVNKINISEIPDGTYEGKFEYSRWLSEVEVKVEGGKIIAIERLSNPLIPDVSKNLFEQIIDKQQVDIDAVSGATATSKAYLKSVEIALSKTRN